MPDPVLDAAMRRHITDFQVPSPSTAPKTESWQGGGGWQYTIGADGRLWATSPGGVPRHVAPESAAYRAIMEERRRTQAPQPTKTTPAKAPADAYPVLNLPMETFIGTPPPPRDSYQREVRSLPMPKPGQIASDKL